MDSLLFTPYKLGPLTLKNRSVRSAAFEGMCPGHLVSTDLINYHRSVAEGGTGMTTVAYAAVSRSGLSFSHQLWLRKEAIPGLKELTSAIHGAGAAAAIQIGHGGLMAKRSVSSDCFSPSGGFNLFGPTWPRAMNQDDIRTVIKDFEKAIHLCREAGFNAVEVHAGHGYLISQFLSPYTNHRKDGYGGSFVNRSRFLREVMEQVMEAAGKDLAILVKMNLRDGFRGGMEPDEAAETARLLESIGVHGLVLSGGFVSRTPMYVMRGRMPVRVMGKYMPERWLGPWVQWFGQWLVRPFPYTPLYFLQDALEIRRQVSLPLVYVGGVDSRDAIETALDAGFELVQIGRALIHDPGFIGKIQSGECRVSACNHTNYCIAVMYAGKMVCYRHDGKRGNRWAPYLEEQWEASH